MSVVIKKCSVFIVVVFFFLTKSANSLQKLCVFLITLNRVELFSLWIIGCYKRLLTYHEIDPAGQLGKPFRGYEDVSTRSLILTRLSMPIRRKKWNS